MTATTFEQDPVVVAFRSWLEAEVRADDDVVVVQVTDSAAPTKPLRLADGRFAYCVLWVLPGNRPDDRPLAGRTRYQMRLQVTTVASNPSLCRTVADRVRKAIAGEDTAGQPLVPITLPGVAVLERSGQDDGAIDLVNGNWQWPETFDIDLVTAD